MTPRDDIPGYAGVDTRCATCEHAFSEHLPEAPYRCEWGDCSSFVPRRPADYAPISRSLASLAAREASIWQGARRLSDECEEIANGYHPLSLERRWWLSRSGEFYKIEQLLTLPRELRDMLAGLEEKPRMPCPCGHGAHYYSDGACMTPDCPCTGNPMDRT